MEKKQFLLYLNPPRPTFAMDMTSDERQIMGAHIEYWTKFMNQGKVIAFGPVFEPTGAYGVGILEVETKEELQNFIANDPSNGLNSFEFYPMKALYRRP
jgi:uncharacterized protein